MKMDVHPDNHLYNGCHLYTENKMSVSVELICLRTLITQVRFFFDGRLCVSSM